MPSKRSKKLSIECLYGWLKDRGLPKPKKEEFIVKAPKMEKAWGR